MAGKSSVKHTNHSDSDENDELFLPPSSTLSFHHAHLRRSEVNQSTTVFRSFSSDLEDDCFHIGLPDGYNAMSGSDVANEKPPLTRQESLMSQSSENEALAHQTRAMRQGSIVDGLLHEIYDHWYGSRRDSFDSDTLTECSSTSEFMWCSRHDIGMYSMDGGYQSSIERRQTGCYTRSFLQTQDVSQLSRILSSIQRLTTVMSARLVRQLKRRDRRLAKRNRNYDVVTAILQAASLKRQIDTRMRFSIAPPQGQPSAFDQWKDAMRAVCRLPMGIPTEFRKKVWLSLADHYLVQLRINWDKTLRFVFNERSNPDDDKLGMQIVKDLHRTGCSNFSGDDNVEDRAILKRVLLAYARWNKRVGYCQGFNVIAALLLNVMDRKEDDALKVMIYLIDSVLPESYFANNLRALSVDMAVFRDLLAMTYPRLSKHLDRLQLQAQDVRTGACYEPPLTNVFTMQWFLTLFATCLPVNVVLRVWDSVLLEGSEILLRTALTIWGKLSKRILGVSSADEFYSVMGELSTSIMQGTVMDGDSIIKSIYALGDFPFPNLNELREKYTYNIRPLTPSTSSGVRKVGGRSLIKAMLYSDDDDIDDDDVTAMACMPGEMSSSSSDISVLGPGVYGSGLEPGGGSGRAGDMQMERMSTDINSLKLQYQRLKERQQQAHIIIAAASQKKAQLISSSSSRKPLSSSSSASTRTRGGGILSLPPSILLPSIESPTAMNHLFVGKHKPPSASARNRLVTQGPCISQHAPLQHKTSAVLSKQLQAVANAQAVSKSQRMKTSKSNTKPGDQAPQVTNTKNTPTTQSCHTENTLTLQGNDNNSDDGKPTPKNVSIETVLTPASETSGSAVSVNNLTEDGVDKLSQDKKCDSLGVNDGSKGGDSQDNKSLCDLTPDPVVNKGNPANAASLDSVVVSVPNDLDNDSISDKSVQTCFEVLDSLDSITDLETGQEDSHNNISRGTPQLHTSLCSVSESSTAPDKSNHEMDTRVATHTTVPYVEKGDDNKLVDPSSRLQLSCNKSHQRADDADISPPNPQITYPLNAIDLPSTNPRTSIVREPQDTQHCILSTNILPLPSTVATNLHPGENLPEDSGIDSSSTASPSTTPKRGPKNTYRSDSLDDGIEIHASQDINPHSNGSSKKDDLLLVTTTTTSLSNKVEIAQTKEGDEADVCKSLSPSSSNFEPGLCDENKLSNHDDSSVSSETHVDEADDHRSDKVCCNDSTAEGVSGGNLSTVNRSDSTDPVNGYADSSYPKDLPSDVEPPSPTTTPSLSTITTTTSPQRKFFRRSVSCTVSSPGLIETVPVPENLTGSGSQKQRIKENTTHRKQQTAGSDSSSQESLRNDVHRQDNHSTRKDAKTTGPVNSKSNSLKTGNTPTYSRRLSTPAACHVTSESASKKPFNPFPVKLFNANRAKTGLKLGLYSATTLEQLKGLKSRTTST